MNGHEIMSIIMWRDHVARAFRGIYTVDQLPDFSLRDKDFIIVNTTRHWTIIHLGKTRNGAQIVEWFDPLGGEPPAEIKPFLLRQRSPCHSRNTAVQSNQSKDCALFCLFYIFMRLDDCAVNEIFSVFSSDLPINDDIVTSYFDTLKK